MLGRFTKIGSKKVMANRYQRGIRSGIRELPRADRYAAREQLKNPGANIKGKYASLMKLKLDRSRVKVGLEPKYRSERPLRSNIMRGFKGFKKLMGKGKVGSVVVAGGGVLATMLLLGKGSLEKGADVVEELGDKILETTESLGGVAGNLVRSGVNVLDKTAGALEFLSENFLLSCALGVGGYVAMRRLTGRQKK